VYDFVADNSFRLIWGSKRKIPQPLKFNDPEPLSFHGILPHSDGEQFFSLFFPLISFYISYLKILTTGFAKSMV